jgi:hypothetical protein
MLINDKKTIEKTLLDEFENDRYKLEIKFN